MITIKKISETYLLNTFQRKTRIRVELSHDVNGKPKVSIETASGSDAFIFNNSDPMMAEEIGNLIACLLYTSDAADEAYDV